MQRGWMVAALLPVLGCSSGPTDGALLAVVKFEVGSTAKCVVVQVRGGGTKLSTLPLARKNKPELRVGIKRSVELQGNIELQAIGFSTDTCVDGSQSELSAVKTGNLDGLGVTTIELVLDGTGQGDGGQTGDGGMGDGGTDVDADNDGYLKSVDCDDLNAAINPGKVESCSNLIDDNCDLAIDCADSACTGATCNDSNACTQLDVCGSGVCVGMMMMACNTPGACEKLPGSCSTGQCSYAPSVGFACGDGGACRSDRSCGFGEVDCANGIDDDNDGGADCVDPACAAQDCDAGVLLCYGRATCQAAACAPLASTLKTCTPPPGGCISGGACEPDAGCVFMQLGAGAGCPGGSCRADGGCGPVEAAALCANQMDDDGDGLTDCQDPSCVGGACNDGNACTNNTLCVGTSCGGGTAVICPPAPVCNVVDQCLADGGCSFVAAPPGATCDGGACSAGVCVPIVPVPDAGVPDAGVPDAGVPVPDGGFAYTPSNFNPVILPSQIAGNIRFTNCAAVFDSMTGLWPNTCLQTVPLPVPVTQAGGELAWLLPMRGLIIDANAALRLQGGGRPVIIAVYGDADLNGPVSARSSGAGVGNNLGAGANWSGCATMNGTNGGFRVAFGAGGGGAAFATDGGNGIGGGATAGSAGGVGKADTLVPLHGGCHGGTGGGAIPTAAGAGGGAVQISASGRLRVNAFVTASGGGGLSGAPSTGGSGAGSGGAVFLEANQLELATGARLICNGGGGGEGGGGTGPGSNGDDGSPLTTVPAIGAPVPPEVDNINGGNGGNGAAGATPAQPGLFDMNSGGGGGGGLGHIRLRAVTSCTNGGAVLSGVVSRTANCPP